RERRGSLHVHIERAVGLAGACAYAAGWCCVNHPDDAGPPRGRDESASTGNAAYQDARASVGQAAARYVSAADAGSPAAAHDEDARGLVGLADGGGLPAVARPAVG